MSPQVLMDTDALSLYMRREAKVVAHVEDYLRIFGRLNISLITRYEISRGLKAQNASTKLQRFDRLCRANTVLPVTDDIIDLAADIYAELHRLGRLIGDADILIGATALAHGLVLATNNEKHFSRISGLQIENWIK